MLKNLISIGGLTRMKHDGETHLLAKTFVGDGDGGCTFHRRVFGSQRFYSGRVYVVSSANNDVLPSTCNAQIPLLVQPPEVSGHEPTGLIKRSFRCELIVEITQHETGAPTADLSNFINRGFFFGIIQAEYPDVIPCGRPATGFYNKPRLVIGTGILVRARFGHPVSALRQNSVLQQSSHDITGYGSAGNPEASKLSHFRGLAFL